MKEIKNALLTGDCLIESDKIASGSVDLILTDLPYGTVKGIGAGSGLDHGMIDKTEWDEAIDPVRIYEIANRILRKNGKMVLFSQEPYTTRLINEANANIPFSYRMIWEKDHFANALIAKKAPVSYYEDVLVFSKTYDTGALHPLREYALKVRHFTSYSRSRFFKELGHGGSQHFLEGNKESSQFTLCTEQTYNELIHLYQINEMDGFTEYSVLKRVDEKFKHDLSSTFNLWEGGKYKSNILRYKKDYDGFHPTQKPVLLLEDLIKTFSNAGDTVVDLTAGSGSTAVAAINAGRDFVAIEQDADYVAIARRRIDEAQALKGGEAVE